VGTSLDEFVFGASLAFWCSILAGTPIRRSLCNLWESRVLGAVSQNMGRGSPLRRRRNLENAASRTNLMKNLLRFVFVVFQTSGIPCLVSNAMLVSFERGLVPLLQTLLFKGEPPPSPKILHRVFCIPCSYRSLATASYLSSIHTTRDLQPSPL